ncbi:AAA family ATPase [Demequina salsinemoris]|uniref:AAA family ATPase n=1 Tax=Demequina salsinemoris TaxID=577470 RepID=UPI0007815C1E|nr:SMC family ATPase [Demequina salsinemoris]
MRILSLEVEGFGPFRAPQSIDFTQFESQGLFVISGRTGAGKSTILDAICFALYDKVPRYDGEKSVRSDFCGPDEQTTVTLEYEIHGERYRIVRSPAYERTKKNGTGTTPEKAKASLYRLGQGDPEPIATMPREVAEHVATTVPLTGEQFLQVILLAQGRFAEFLKADTKDRRTLLRSLFSTQRFEDLESRIRDLAKDAAAKVETADAGLASLAARAATLVGADAPPAQERTQFFAEQEESLAAAAASATESRVTAVAEAQKASDALQQARADEEARTRLARARATLSELEDQAEDHEQQVARLALARRAVAVAGPRRALDQASAAEGSALEALETAHGPAESNEGLGIAWPDGSLRDATADALETRITALTGERGELKDAIEAESSLPGLESAVQSSVAAVAEALEAQAATQRRADAIPEKEKELRLDLEATAMTAARTHDLEEQVARAARAVAAHAEVARLEEQAGPIGAREAEAAAASAERSIEHADLVRRRLASQAAHLATELVDERPCAVCGSTVHPSPAEPTEDHVTDDEVDAAYAAAQAASQMLENARGQRVEHDKSIATAREAAGDGGADDAAAALASARAEHTAARDAAIHQDGLKASLDALEQEKTVLLDAQSTHAQALADAREAQTRASAALESARTRASDLPDGYESARDYAAALDGALALLGRVESATRAVATAAAGVAAAREALGVELASAGFATAQEAAEAALPSAELAELEGTVASHRERLASAKGVVAELSAREIPAEPADLEALETAATEAARTREAAVEEATASAGRARQFAALHAEHLELGRSTEAARATRDTIVTLADALEGKPPNDRRLRLESFVLASKLERIVAAANARLETMSSGQYRLEHDDSAQYRNKEAGLALSIADAHTGRSRSTQSLSGGETFLASLALALGLAETVSAEAGGIQLDTLFIDEGFGSLDEETLEVAMATLEDLRDQGRTVGLISHVETMKEAIPAKLEVTKSADGSSRVLSRPNGD